MFSSRRRGGVPEAQGIGTWPLAPPTPVVALVVTVVVALVVALVAAVTIAKHAEPIKALN